jgi:hypothetical protein
MKRHHLAMAVSVLALAAAPSTALAGGGSLGGLVQQTQTATNSNETNQTANSTATSEQTNVNAPVSILSEGSNNGDVNQSNEGETSSSAQNNNGTEQGNWQNQEGSASGNDSNGHDCGCSKGGSQVEQRQTGENSNTTNQTAESSATNQQENVNAPYTDGGKGSKGSDCGCEGQRHKDGGGDVNQSNKGDTSSSAQNNNGTEQSNHQNQEGSAS